MSEFKLYVKGSADIDEKKLNLMLSLITTSSLTITKKKKIFLIQGDESVLIDLLSSFLGLKSDLHLDQLLFVVVPFFSADIENLLNKKEEGIYYLYELLSYENSEDTLFLEELLRKVPNEILKTVKIYLNFNLSVQKTSQYLFTHRNTINYRINRFIKLTQIDIRQYPNSILVANLLSKIKEEN